MRSKLQLNFQALPCARLFLCILVLLACFSCKKEKKAAIQWTEYSAGTAMELKSIFTFTNSDTLYVCGGVREQSGSILRSTDNGLTWQSCFESNSISFSSLYFKNSSIGFALGDFLDIYKTTDGGLNWVHCRFNDSVSYNYRVVLRKLDFLNDSVAFACGGDDFGNGILLKSTDKGDSWKKIRTEDHELRDIYFKQDNTAYTCGYGILLHSADAGESWDATSLGDEFFTSLCFADESTAYLSGYNGNLYKSIDGGGSWSQSKKGNSLFSSQRVHFTSLDFSTSQTGIAVGEEGYALITQDGASSWELASTEKELGLNQVKFISEKSGWAVGKKGSLLKFEIQ